MCSEMHIASFSITFATIVVVKKNRKLKRLKVKVLIQNLLNKMAKFFTSWSLNDIIYNKTKRIYT